MKTLKNLTYILLTLILIGGVSSCTKKLDTDENPSIAAQTMDDLYVTETFDFQTSQTLDIKIIAADHIGLPALKIELFDANPNEDGKTIKTGITNKEQEFQTTVTLPSDQEVIYIRRTTNSGTIETVTMDITGKKLEYTFANNKSANAMKGNVSGPGCTDCTTSISSHEDGILTINSGETVCILSGASFNGGININGGTLKVCGTLTLQWMNGGGTIIINDDGTFISSNLNWNSTELVIENYSDAFMVNNISAIQGTFRNWGTIPLTGLNVNSNGSLFNYGIINLANHFNNSGITYNEGTMNIAGNLNNNSNSPFENYCKLIVAGDFNNNSTLDNYSYIDINGELNLNGDGDLQMYDGALVETASMTTLDNAIVGNGANYSKITIGGSVVINGSGSVSGNMDFCVENDITNNGNIAPSVTFCEASIDESYCNPGSNGTGGSGGNDTDGDGVDDEFDEYPSDPDRAFNNYYPNENTFGTLAFEDLWPYKGDYDFNDMVVDYQFNTVTNANDNAVEVYVSLKVMAIGAGFKNGFGIELPIDNDAVSGVTGDFSMTQNIISLDGRNLESGQSNAVIVFFDNAFDLLPHPGDGTGVNTRNGATYVDPQQVDFLVSFAYPVSAANLGQAPFNPFIFVNGERGREVHMKNNTPTDLADLSLFGTGQDESIPSSGYYYKSSNNLPWAINITNGFDYPIEKTAIIDAYNYFGQWAESAGANYADWYTNSAGYRNTNVIYTP